MSKVDQSRFKDGHYIGLPAEHNDLFVQRRAELVRQIPGFTGKNLSLADVGCGNGNTLFLFTSEFEKCVGIDIFPENREAFELLKKANACSNCDFLLVDIEKADPGLQFDRIVCFEVIEHLQDEQNVSKLYDLLKPGGMLAITVPHKWWLLETHGAKLPLLPWNRVPFFSWLPACLHERWANARIYTKKRIVRLLQDAGFTVMEAKLMTAPLDVLKDTAFKRFLLKHVFRNVTTKNPFLATNVFVWGIKK